MKVLILILIVSCCSGKSLTGRSGRSDVQDILEQLNLNDDPMKESSSSSSEKSSYGHEKKKFHPIHKIPYDSHHEEEEHELDYDALENCREFVNPKPKNARQCILRRKRGGPDDRSYEDDDHHDEEAEAEAFEAETAAAFRRFKVGKCRWDHEAEVCLCPRSQEMCYAKKLKEKCYWHEEPSYSYDYDGYKVHDENPHGECVTNAERFYNILHKLLVKRGKKDFAIRLNYNSIPARSELPYGPHGPSIIKYGTSSRNSPKYYNKYFSLTDHGGYGSYVPSGDPSYLEPYGRDHYGHSLGYESSGSYGPVQGYEQSGYGYEQGYGGQAYDTQQVYGGQQAYGGQEYYAQPVGYENSYGTQNSYNAYGTQQEAYGTQQGSYGQQATYGAQQTTYGPQQTAYGTQQGTYGAQQTAYGTQQGAYGAQQTAYGSQQGAYGIHSTQESYGQETYASPKQETYGTEYGSPDSAYVTADASYEQSAPVESYGTPQSYPEAQPSYPVPQNDQPSYPQQSYAVPYEQPKYQQPSYPQGMSYVPQPVYESANYAQPGYPAPSVQYK